MNPSFYAQYKTLKDSGRRTDATTALGSFIASFADGDEKIAWTRWYLESEHVGHKIRHELYEHVIFPVLQEGYKKHDPWSLRWLARTPQNLYQCERLWKLVDWKTQYAFLKEVVLLCPDDEVARQELLMKMIDRFRYCVHEWPAGILYGIDGATTAQCEEILGEIALARQLDREQRFTAFFSDFEEKVVEY